MKTRKLIAFLFLILILVADTIVAFMPHANAAYHSEAYVYGVNNVNSGTFTNPTNAYDNLTTTGAYKTWTGASWSNYLIVNMSGTVKGTIATYNIQRSSTTYITNVTMTLYNTTGAGTTVYNNNAIWGASATASGNLTFSSSVYTAIGWEFYNSRSSNSYTAILNETTCVNASWNDLDSTPPTYSTIGSTNTVRTVSTTFYCLWADNVNVSGFIFGTNNTGTWVNQTWTSTWTGWQTSTSAWANYTTTLNGTKANVVQYEWWCNDTSTSTSGGNWNSTGLKSLTVTLYPWTASPTYSSSTTWSTSGRWTAKNTISFSKATTWSTSGRWTAKESTTFSTTSSWSLSKYAWAAKTKPTISISTTWSMATTWVSSIGMSFSKSSSWNLSPIWGATINPTCSFSSTWSTTSSWASSVANTFSSAITWLISPQWTATLPPNFVATTTWSLTPHWIATINPTLSATTSWTTSWVYMAIQHLIIALSFLTSSSWNIVAHWTARITPAFNSATSWLQNPHWIAKIQPTFASSTAWLNSAIQHTLSHFIISLSFHSATVWYWGLGEIPVSQEDAVGYTIVALILIVPVATIMFFTTRRNRKASNEYND